MFSLKNLYSHLHYSPFFWFVKGFCQELKKIKVEIKNLNLWRRKDYIPSTVAMQYSRRV
jgi:hypothetical protein